MKTNQDSFINFNLQLQSVSSVFRGVGPEVSLVLAHHHGHDHDDEDGSRQTAEDDPDVPGHGVGAFTTVSQSSLQPGHLTVLKQILDDKICVQSDLIPDPLHHVTNHLSLTILARPGTDLQIHHQFSLDCVTVLLCDCVTIYVTVLLCD